MFNFWPNKSITSKLWIRWNMWTASVIWPLKLSMITKAVALLFSFCSWTDQHNAGWSYQSTAPWFVHLTSALRYVWYAILVETYILDGSMMSFLCILAAQGCGAYLFELIISMWLAPSLAMVQVEDGIILMPVWSQFIINSVHTSSISILSITASRNCTSYCIFALRGGNFSQKKFHKLKQRVCPVPYNIDMFTILSKCTSISFAAVIAKRAETPPPLFRTAVKCSCNFHQSPHQANFSVLFLLHSFQWFFNLWISSLFHFSKYASLTNLSVDSLTVFFFFCSLHEKNLCCMWSEHISQPSHAENQCSFEEMYKKVN